MKLSTRSLYGLRLLYHLAGNYNNGPLQLRTVAEREDISEKYLGQIVILLRSAGIINSVRGNQGGYLLAHKPSELSVLEVVETLEGEFLERIEDDTPVTGSSQRATREIWRRLGDSMRQVLGSVSLADLVELSSSDAALDFVI